MQCMSKRTERIVVLLTPTELEEVDRFADTLPIRPNRSDVIRELLRRGLDSTTAMQGSATAAPTPPAPKSPAPSSVVASVPDIAALVRAEVEKVMAQRAPDTTPALDPEAEAEGLRKIMGFVERNRVPPPPEEPRQSIVPEPTIEELQAKALALRAERAKRPDFKPVRTRVVPLPGEGVEGGDLYPLEPLDNLVEGEEGYEPPEETSEDEDEDEDDCPW